MRSREAYSPRAFSGFRDHSLPGGWTIGALYQLNVGVPIGAGSWGDVQVLSPGEVGTWVLQPILAAAPPPNIFRIDVLEACIYDVTDQDLAEFSFSGSGSLTLPAGFGASTGTYTFTGTDGTTDVGGLTSPLSVPFGLTGTLQGPPPKHNIVGMSVAIVPYLPGAPLTYRNPLDLVVASTDQMINYCHDVYLVPTFAAGFSGRSWGVSIPKGPSGAFQYGAGYCTAVTFANSANSFASVALLPYLRILGELI
jgi:hypothetical protein